MTAKDYFKDYELVVVIGGGFVVDLNVKLLRINKLSNLFKEVVCLPVKSVVKFSNKVVHLYV